MVVGVSEMSEDTVQSVEKLEGLLNALFEQWGDVCGDPEKELWSLTRDMVVELKRRDEWVIDALDQRLNWKLKAEALDAKVKDLESERNDRDFWGGVVK